MMNNLLINNCLNNFEYFQRLIYDKIAKYSIKEAMYYLFIRNNEYDIIYNKNIVFHDSYTMINSIYGLHLRRDCRYFDPFIISSKILYNKIIDIIEYSKSSCSISDLYLKNPFKYHGYYYTRISYDKYYLTSYSSFIKYPKIILDDPEFKKCNKVYLYYLNIPYTDITFSDKKEKSNPYRMIFNNNFIKPGKIIIKNKGENL